ncbi:hypothetical protein Tco_0985703 [Tanacetum coccineum]
MGITNQNGNGNVVAAWAEGNGNGNNVNQIRCYNCRGVGHYATNHTIEEVNANCILIANLQQASSSEEEYTELLKSTTKTQLDQQNAINVIPTDSSMEHSRGIVEQHPVTVEETHAYFESLYNNLVIKVEKVNTINREMKEKNDDLTTELARYKGNEKCFKFNQAE